LLESSGEEEEGSLDEVVASGILNG